MRLLFVTPVVPGPAYGRRPYNFIKVLSAEHEVHLLCASERPASEEEIRTLKSFGVRETQVVPHPKWKDEYTKTLELMDKYIDPKRIIWISLGSLRFMPGLKPIIRRRHPNTCVLDGEFIMGLDGKMRYFKPIRMELYGFMRENLEELYPDPCLYLCMDSSDVWRKSMGWSPEDSMGLRRYLDGRVVEIFE